MELDLPAFVTSKFPPSEKDLLKLLITQTKLDMLVEIASCDHGNSIEENLSSLKEICRTTVLPSRLPWHPREVVSLTRWSEPDELRPYRSHGERGHLIRLFSCTVLLMAGGDRANDGYIDGENVTLAQAVESSIFLGPDFLWHLAQLLTWRAQSLREGHELRTFIPFTLLVILHRLRLLSIDWSNLLVECLERESIAMEEYFGEFPLTNDQYCHSFLRFETMDQRHRKWLGFAFKLKDELPDHTEIQLYTTKMLLDA